ncbi:hypothetical protein CRE_11641 [Caenorhabditis remanei]|uniref:Uncharacterized protein n=1 Tax=Caenorhabditis remanei TaxID=31234 RepID=E3NVD9_CAERE|nr:hypothetical protein CRE_11641 [Caenorhabditis remanei]
MYSNHLPQYSSAGSTDLMWLNQQVMWNNGQYGYPHNGFQNTHHYASHNQDWSQQGPAHGFQGAQLAPKVLDNPDNIRKRQEGLLINTRCRYIPVLSIYSQQSEIASRQFLKSFEIDVTQFVAVTCVNVSFSCSLAKSRSIFFQNTAVVNWKTANNKFARVDYKENLRSLIVILRIRDILDLVGEQHMASSRDSK